MFSATVDHWLTHLSAPRRTAPASVGLPTLEIQTPVGAVRVHDTESRKPCVVLVPDGPNVIEHYEPLIALLARHLRVVCFDMPGFGHSLPQRGYTHSLDQGARAVLGVLDDLRIQRAALAFSCANGFYALRASQHSPERISSLILSQTPSLKAMHAWADRVIPWPLRVPVIGQIAAWSFRRRAASSWYRTALPPTTPAEPFQRKALDALANGGCFCLAGVVQGLEREVISKPIGITTPCVMIWGSKDRSHQQTDPRSLLEIAPNAAIVRFDDCGHFPDLEQPERFAALVLQNV